MLTDWAAIRKRIQSDKSDEAKLSALFAEVLGPGPDWLTVYRDWLARWYLNEPRDFHRGANVDAFLRDSVIESPHDPEAAAILLALRQEFIIKPIDGTGRTGFEVLGEIRQAVREYRINRAAAASHKGGEYEAALRDGMATTAEFAVRALCQMMAELASKMGLEVDCFCGEKIPETSRRMHAAEGGFVFDMRVIQELGRLIASVPQNQEQSSGTAQQQPGPYGDAEHGETINTAG